MAPLGKHRQSLGVPRAKSAAHNHQQQQGDKPATVLKLWIIRIQSGGVLVEGYRDVSENDATTLQNWRSTFIAERIDAKTLQTHSGSVYKLKGGIDEDEAAEAGIPEELIEAFERGFPEDWKERVEVEIKRLERTGAIRRQSLNVTTTTTTNTDRNKENRAEGGGGASKKPVLQFDNTTMDGEKEETEEEREERLADAKKKRSLQKGRKSLLPLPKRAATPIEEEEEEEEKTPARRSGRTPSAAAAAADDKKTPGGRGRGAGRTPKVAGGSPAAKKGRKETEEEEEVFATPDEAPRTKAGKRAAEEAAASSSRPLQQLQLAIPAAAAAGGKPQQQQHKRKPPPKTPARRRASLEEIPREILASSVPLTRWVLRFVRGGSPASIFPHFQFKCCGFRPECEEQEWSTSVIQKVMPPYMMFTSSSIYRLDGPLDVDQATDMGFPPAFISDFLMGFPDDWEQRLEEFFNKTFGPPPQLKIVEVTSECGTVEGTKGAAAAAAAAAPAADKKKQHASPAAVAAAAAKKQQQHDNGMDMDMEAPVQKRKLVSYSSSSSSSSSGSDDDDDEDDYEELQRAARRVEKQMRREEQRERREAEHAALQKEEKKKRFEVKINRTPAGVAVSRSGRTLRTPLANWAGEKITYDAHGNVVEMTGVTTETKMTMREGVTKDSRETEKLAAHFGIDSPLEGAAQKERATALPSAERAAAAAAAAAGKTPAARKSKAAYKGYSDDETDKIMFEQYKELLRAQADATPAFNKKRGEKRRWKVVESSDPEAEEEERKREKKRIKKEERRRLKESEDEESSDDGWRKKRRPAVKPRKMVVVKREKTSKTTTSSSSRKSLQQQQPRSHKKSAAAAAAVGGRRKKREEEQWSDEDDDHEFDIDHDEDAVTFVPSEGEGGGCGYSDDDRILSDEEESERRKRKSGKGKKKEEEQKEKTKRAKKWKKEELIRLKLAIQAADMSAPDGWATVARSLGGERTEQECKKIAREKQFVAAPAQEFDDDEEGEESGEESDASIRSGAASEDDEKKKRMKGRMEETGMKGVTAKKGTAAYAVQMEQAKRDVLLGAAPTASQDDIFRDAAALPEHEALPSVAVFDPDDSLIECLDDAPVQEQPKQRNTKTARMAAAPATPRLQELSSTFDSTPAGTSSSGGGARTTRRSSGKFVPSPVVNQSDLTRYVHQLSRSNMSGMMSKSMAADRSRMMPPPPLPAKRGGRTMARNAEAIEQVERSLRNKRPTARDDLGDVNEEDEEGNDVFPAGF